VNGED